MCGITRKGKHVPLGIIADAHMGGGGEGGEGEGRGKGKAEWCLFFQDASDVEKITRERSGRVADEAVCIANESLLSDIGS